MSNFSISIHLIIFVSKYCSSHFNWHLGVPVLKSVHFSQLNMMPNLSSWKFFFSRWHVGGNVQLCLCHCLAVRAMRQNYHSVFDINIRGWKWQSNAVYDMRSIFTTTLCGSFWVLSSGFEWMWNDMFQKKKVNKLSVTQNIAVKCFTC